MGQEIDKENFSDEDRAICQERMSQELEILCAMAKSGKISKEQGMSGFELEHCLLENDFSPLAKNVEFLEKLKHPLFTTELASFNFEYNSTPQQLQDDALSQFEFELDEALRTASKTAAKMNAKVLSCGILPTATPAHFTLPFMSQQHRYHAMNNEILKMRHGHGIKINIEGHDELHLKIDSVMLEAATTSFQLHFQTAANVAHDYYNASLLLAAPLLAISANSPILFGKSLWRETRIPVFEQAVKLGTNRAKRVFFPNKYCTDFTEFFVENNEKFGVLLPVLRDDAPEKFTHMRFQNGVIWRWMRPIIGFDEDGTPHFRIENRILPAGPTNRDMVANAAFYYGLLQYFAHKPDYFAKNPIEDVHRNFYSAARFGIQSDFLWNGVAINARDLILNQLLDFAADGLSELKIDQKDIKKYLNIIKARADTRRTGANWQRRAFEIHEYDCHKMLRQYWELQNSGLCVHEWPLKAND